MTKKEALLENLMRFKGTEIHQALLAHLERQSGYEALKVLEPLQTEADIWRIEFAKGKATAFKIDPVLGLIDELKQEIEKEAETERRS